MHNPELGSGVNASLEDCKFADVRTGVAGHIVETHGVGKPATSGAGELGAAEAAKALHKCLPGRDSNFLEGIRRAGGFLNIGFESPLCACFVTEPNNRRPRR